MKLISKLLLTFLATATFLLSACNPVAEDDRYEAVAPAEINRVVLIEDFTGQNCINCPAAHEVIELLQEQYPGAVVAVSIHAGAFGIPVERTNLQTGYIGLMTADGQILNDSWNVDTWPSGVIDRNGGAIGHNEWAAAVRNELQRTPHCDLKVSAKLSADRKNIEIQTTVEPRYDINGQLHIWVTESGIVGRQRTTGNKIISDYVHNNVFRAAITPLEGQPERFVQFVHRSFEHSIELRANEHEVWDPEQITIVAFVTEDDGVTQVATSRVYTL